MSIDIKIDMSEAIKALDPAKMEEAIAATLDGAASILRADIKQYPAPPPQSTYIRTGKLGQAWAQKVDKPKMQAVIGNHMAYAPFVQDRDRQAWMHRGRWQTAQDVAQKRAQDVKRLIEQALARWAR